MNVLEMFRLDGKVGFVTGGARTLGFDMAEALAEAGADVAITSRTLASAETSSQELARTTGRDILPLQLDVRDEAQVEAAVAKTLDHFGRIDGTDAILLGIVEAGQRPGRSIAQKTAVRHCAVASGGQQCGGQATLQKRQIGAAGQIVQADRLPEIAQCDVADVGRVLDPKIGIAESHGTA